MRPAIALPDAVRNPVSLAGIVVTTTTGVLFLVLLILEAAGAITNPYLGLLVFVTVPVIFVAGLLLVPAGAWWSRRRRRLHPELTEWPVIDLGKPRHRAIAVWSLVLTGANVMIVSLAAYGGVHYMDSPAFCGQVCHTTMEPQFAAYQAWPHARVGCVQCHIGSGAGAAVEAKMAGTRQLYHLLTNQVPTPVPPPERLIQPSHGTCETCHWSELRHGDRLRVIREYANDEQNTETVTTLRLHVGGGAQAADGRASEGIHWHANLDRAIEFVAPEPGTDVVPYVRLTDANGGTHDYFAPGVTAGQVASAPRRRMDCTDCHNRPAHTMYATPERGVDTAMAAQRIPRELPFSRRESVAALKRAYPSRDAGLAGISTQLTAFYNSRPGTDARLVQRAVTGTQELWTRNVFPAMKVTWGTYPNHLGHVDSVGCFRCHDDEHKTADGRVIGQSCELCHTAPE
jgi:nitrate/TMAO reductase-like tetraheme cytochrome c subunit